MIVGSKNSNRLPSTWTEVTATYIAERHRWEPREGEPADKPTTVVGTIRQGQEDLQRGGESRRRTLRRCDCRNRQRTRQRRPSVVSGLGGKSNAGRGVKMNAKELANLMRKEAEISSKAYQQMILRRTARDIEKYIVPHYRPPQPSDDGKWCFLEQFSDLAPCLCKLVS